MRALAMGAVIALSFLVVSCSDEDRPNDVPRTVPPVSDGAAALPAKVHGVGPTIEVIAYAVSVG